MQTQFMEIENGVAIPMCEVPAMIFEEFRDQALRLVKNGAKIVQFFGYQEKTITSMDCEKRVGSKEEKYATSFSEDRVKLIAVLRTDKLSEDGRFRLFAAGSVAPERYPSLTSECEQFNLFEREIAEQFGVVPENHPWFKMVRYHANWRGREDVFENSYDEDIPGNYSYYSVEGKEIHEVAVGPVHAGVIEPGHFRFNCIGEKVLNLEIQLGYQHRGVETLMVSAPAERLPVIIESVAGDTSIGSSLCFAQAIEALSLLKQRISLEKQHRTGDFDNEEAKISLKASCSKKILRQPDTGAKKIRTVALELERIANHVGDLGALSGDVAFLPPANYCGRMRGDFLNMTLLICGNRFGKGLVRPGGVRFSIDEKLRLKLLHRIGELEAQVANVIDLLLITTPSVRDRFEGCGAVSRADAHHMGLVGPAGRACGLPYDARREFPTEFYREIDIPENCRYTGDVSARAWIRAEEVMQSISIVKNILSEPVYGLALNEKDQAMSLDSEGCDLPPDSFVVTLNEAWRGEISHSIMTGNDGSIIRYKIKDPSFHNWSGLSMSLRNTGISDFPLNNKSYNLSYCGFDL